MKKSLLVFIVFLLSINTWAEKAEIGGINYNLVANVKQAEVINKTIGSYSGDIIIPNTVTYKDITYNVTSIHSSAFYNCSGLTSITIPNSVTSIGNYAFWECSCLTSVTIPNSVTSIEAGVFKNCSGLTSIYIPNSVTNIGIDAFYNCSGLTSITIPNSVTSIGNGAFQECSGLVSINIPNSVTSIGVSVFQGCKSLTSVIIPNSIKTINKWAFQDCSSLASVILPSSVKQLEDYAFAGCCSLTSIDIPSYLSIGNYCFSGCCSLSSINIPHNANVGFGNAAFDGCSSLSSIYIPNSVTSIGNITFRNCVSLTSIEIPSSVTHIYWGAFSGCSGLKSITIPNSVQTIYNGAFSGCTSLQSLAIPESVTYIGEKAFDGCELEPLLIYGDPRFEKETFSGLSSESVIYFKAESISRLQNNEIMREHNMLPIDRPYGIKIKQNYLMGTRIELVPNPYVFFHSTFQSLTVNDKVIEPSVDGSYTADFIYYIYNTNLPSVITNEYKIQLNYTDGSSYYIKRKTKPLHTNNRKINNTQTTLHIDIYADVDELSKVKECNLNFLGNKYTITIPSEQNDSVCQYSFEFNNLTPGRKYSYNYSVVYENGFEFSRKEESMTQKINPIIYLQESSPTTIKCRGSYDLIDAHLLSASFKGYETDGQQLVLTGLSPNSKYNITYCVKTVEGSTDEVTKTISTATLKMNNLPPKVSNKGEAIVCAETNIVDIEQNVGFEWRKIDAPNEIASKSGLGVIYEGTIEGVIKNLDANSYYKVRPFYESNSGERYYGEWIGFDPSDFSYYEPTVHTYSIVEVHEGIAMLSGYVLQGSDEILEQGFEYWFSSPVHARAPQGTVMIVKSTGQRMTAQINNLQEGAIYGYRAYVKTVKGTTYGEEMTFSTPMLSGIEETVVDCPVAFDVFNISGQKVRSHVYSLDGLSHGIYIVNGRKIIVK